MSRLPCQRDAFTLPDDLHYLNCAYMSPLSLRVQEAGIGGVRRKGNPATITADDFFDDVDKVRRLFARVVRAPSANRISVLPSVSYGMATVVRNTPIEPGQSVVTVRYQFPSNVHPWERMCAGSGARLRMVEPPSDGPRREVEWNEAILEAIGTNTAIVSLGLVHWTDGTRFDVERIARRARDVGAVVVIDGTQSIGAVPFDFEAVRPDALVCATYKWLMGPYSVALAYFGPRYDEGIPLEEGWMGRQGSHDFAGLVNPSTAYRSGGARYDVGETSNFALIPMVIAGLEQVLEWQVERIDEYCRQLSGGFYPGAGHLFGLQLPADVDPAAVKSHLQARNVFVSVRGRAIRVSPYLYNDSFDMEALVSALDECGAGARMFSTT